MKANPKPWLYGPDWQGVRCEAKTRRGTLCQRPGTKRNGRCRLHGGRSSGPKTKGGLERLIASKVTHGQTTAAKRAEAKRSAEIGRQVRAELREIEQWAMDHGHLSKDWREQFYLSHCHSSFSRKNKYPLTLAALRTAVTPVTTIRMVDFHP